MNLPVPENSLDVLGVAFGFRNLANYADGLAEMHRVLKPGGKLILSTPFILPIHDAPRDYFRFTRHGLAMLLANFRKVVISERNTYFEAIDVLWLRLLQTDTNAARTASMLLIPIVYFLKRPLSLLLGRLVRTDAMTTGYVVTAVK